MEEFIEEIIKKRKKFGLSQEDLGTFAGCSRSAINSYENRYSTPPLDTALKIASTLHINLKYIPGE